LPDRGGVVSAGAEGEIAWGVDPDLGVGGPAEGEGEAGGEGEVAATHGVEGAAGRGHGEVGPDLFEIEVGGADLLQEIVAGGGVEAHLVRHARRPAQADLLPLG